MSTTRRQLVIKSAQALTVGAVGGTLWFQLLNSQSTAHASMLRPPGAENEKDFLGSCIKCGNCVQDCPFDALDLAKLGQKNTPGTPYFVAREEPCHMCPDIPCVKACPTGALNPEMTQINSAEMGVATINEEACLAYLGLRCEICYRVCPKMDSAVTLRYREQKRTGKHAFLEPVIHFDECTGCGMCEHSCPTDEAAIRVFPKSLTSGAIGKHYRLGWKHEGKITREFKAEKGNQGPQSKKENNALKTLNSGDNLYD